MKLSKKGQVLQNFGAMAVGVAGLTISLVVTFLILSQAKTQGQVSEGLDYATASNCSASYVCNATGALQNAVKTIPGWIPLVIIAVIGSVLIGLVSLFRR